MIDFRTFRSHLLFHYHIHIIIISIIMICASAKQKRDFGKREGAGLGDQSTADLPRLLIKKGKIIYRHSKYHFKTKPANFEIHK